MGVQWWIYFVEFIIVGDVVVGQQQMVWSCFIGDICVVFMVLMQSMN